MDMNMVIEMDGEIVVLIPAGNFVASVTGSFHTQINRLFGNDCKLLLLDLSRITFMDSSGLDAVMSTSKRASDCGGILVCAALQDNVQKLFRVTWADQKISIAATRTAGLQMIRGLKADQV